MQNSFILASSSINRLKLLNDVNLSPKEIIHPNIDESIKKKELPVAYVKRLAYEKAINVYNNSSYNKSSLILAADTIIVKGGKIIGKPKNKQEAFKIISLLAGTSHKVYTSYCIMNKHGKYTCKYIKTSITLRNMSNTEIQSYINTNEWKNRSGGYSILGNIQLYVKKINGSISSVVGLPIMQVNSILSSFNND